MIKSDLHVHTTASDSLFTPKEVVQWANKKNVRIISITDHDTVDGINSAIYEANLYNITVIPGIELSCDYNGEEIHILGYYIDYESEKIYKVTKKLIESRLSRGEKIISRLIDIGYDISFEQVKKVANEGVIGRPHIARVLMENGYIKSIEEGFSKLLAKNKPAYVERFKLSIKESIDLIHEIGGVSVLAHPGLIKNSNIISEIVAYGIDGIEVVHSKHSINDTIKYSSYAESHDLFKTGGSDCHGVLIENNPLLGEYSIDYEQIKKLIEKASYYNKRRDLNECGQRRKE